MIYKTKPTLFYSTLITIATLMSLLINTKGFVYDFYDYLIRFIIVLLVLVFDCKIFIFYEDRIEIFYPFKLFNRYKHLEKDCVISLEYLHIKAPLNMPQFFIEFRKSKLRIKKLSFVFYAKKTVDKILEVFEKMESIGWKIKIIDERKK